MACAVFIAKSFKYLSYILSVELFTYIIGERDYFSTLSKTVLLILSFACEAIPYQVRRIWKTLILFHFNYIYFYV